jgi:aldose 1-epimerase
MGQGSRTVLKAGELELHLTAEVGGSIARFDRLSDGRRQPLMRGTDADDVGPRDAACFPLVPFANRVRGGRFTCGGREIVLAPNMPPDPNPLHGQGWLAAWRVVASSESQAELAFVHEPGEWPWRYEARQQFTVDAEGVSIVLTCRNISEEPMPCALGLHPYFPCDRETVLDTEVDRVWTVDADVLPVDQLPATGRYALRERRICGAGLDNGFGGWRGTAHIHWPKSGAALRLTSPDARYFQVYAPAAGGVFVAEPVQNANAALNEPEGAWKQLGIDVLDLGQERTLRVRFDAAQTGSRQE